MTEQIPERSGAVPESNPEKTCVELIQVSSDEVGGVNGNIENASYYHGYVTEEEIQKLLTKSGDFLVRKTEIGTRLHYAISILINSKVNSLLIKRTKKKKMYYVSKYAFSNVSDLIDYHHRNYLPIYEGIYLINPVPKRFWQMNHEQVELIRKVGEGQFGEVHAGTVVMSTFLKPVRAAVKTLHNCGMNHDERIKFLKEANVMLELQHPNVVRFYGICSAKEPIMIVMEFCDGGSLDSYLIANGNKLDSRLRMYVLFGAACGLDYLHKSQIIHRDVAARNCLLDNDIVKISDFGLSVKGLHVKERKGGKLPVKYMAPETLKRGYYTPASDVYSYGALIYEVYNNGQIPFYDVEMGGNEIRKAILKQKLILSLDNVEPLIKSLFDGCRAYEAKDRITFPKICETLGEAGQFSYPKTDKPLAAKVFNWVATRF